MSSKNSALASLTETYTDSENEDDHSSDDSPNTEGDGSSESQPSIFRPPSKSTTPTKPHPDNSQPTINTNNSTSITMSAIVRPLLKSSLRLVSYNDDTAISDEENVSPNRDNVNMDISEEEGETQSTALGGGSNNADNQNDLAAQNKEQIERQQIATMKKDKITEYGFNLPAEPKGKCPQELQDKINNMYEKIKNGMDMNKLIQERKEFRNPSIYEKLIQFCDINELGTNYPNELYDPLQWGKESFYEELARVQKVEMERREKERKESLKQDAVMAAAKKAEEESKKRKSKWDQPAPNVTAAAAQAKVAASVVVGNATAGVVNNVVQSSLTTNITGTKGTVISAFGSLPKKPKP